MIDVIIPVYRGLLETQACLESVWHARSSLSFQLIVINDCSPDDALSEWLRVQVGLHSMVLLENTENLGFVATVNRGMSVSDEHDVLLLNSDTEVADGWLERIHRTAYSSPDIGTVTPFSNNATICSYPAFCQDNMLPDEFTVESLDPLFAEANSGVVIDIPTAVGFCMYIRREVLRKIGLFDVERFGKGYGEENDFCCRASAAGYRNVLAADVFVWHKGNVSFGDSHNERKQKCLETLQQLHPAYIPNVHRHIQADPAREARLRVDFLRWQKRSLPRILFVTHDRGGGTEQHCRELADLLEGKAFVFRLGAEPGGITAVTGYSRGETAAFHFVLPEEYSNLVQLLRHVGICRVHIHHTIRVDNTVWNLARDLGVPQDYTAHDYFAMCPQITLTNEQNRYCGELGEAQCSLCLQKRPVVGRLSIVEWRARYRELLQHSDRVIVPADSVLARYRHYFALDNLVLAAHPDSLPGWQPSVVPLSVPTDRCIRVAVLGALSPMKGPDILESAVFDARSRALPITYKLFGYAYRNLSEGDKLEVHGSYEPADLHALLIAWKPDVVWFPALWPETYSYTLSECFRLGLPVLVSDLGALADRIKLRPHSWVFPWDLSGREWNDRIIEVNQEAGKEIEDHFHVQDSAAFYLDSYLPVDRLLSPSRLGLPPDVLLKFTRYRVLTQHQRSRIRLLEILVSLRGHVAFAWLAKRVPMSFQRRLKDRLLGR